MANTKKQRQKNKLETRFDSLLDKSVDEIWKRNTINWITIQRKFAIGYLRVKRILSQLEFLGLVDRSGGDMNIKVIKDKIIGRINKIRQVN